MHNKISQEEKLKFYKLYNRTETQKELLEIEDDAFKVSCFASMIGFAIAIVSIAFSSWLFISVVPIFALVSSSIAKGFKRKKDLIENLTENITYKDYKHIRKYEWLKLARTIELEQLEKRKCKCKCPDKNPCPYESKYTHSVYTNFDEAHEHENDLYL